MHKQEQEQENQFSHDRTCLHHLVLDFPTERENEIATLFLDKNGHEVQQFTYQSLKQSCLKAARRLTKEVSKNQLVLLSLEDPSEFVIGFFACLIAGAVPAPLQAFRHAKDKESITRIKTIAHAESAAEKPEVAVLMSIRQQALFEQSFADVPLKSVTIESLFETCDTTVDFARSLPDITPDSIAYIQYTSGSTSHPKGVCLTHGQVMANLAHMSRTFKRKERARVVGWLPFHHDLGLVGLLFTTLYETGKGVFLPPSSFLSEPGVWFNAIHQYQGNIAAVPAFAIEHSLQKVSPDTAWDLSCLKYLYVGSETVRFQPLMDFIAKFESVGISPHNIYLCYGLAEATLLAAGGDRPFADLIHNFVSTPTGIASSSDRQQRRLAPYPFDKDQNGIAIIDTDTGKPLPEGSEGEIVISAPYIFSGYYDAKSGQFPTDSAALRTGDVGFIAGDFLYITGRYKEIVIVRGVNYHAEDLECCAKYDVPFLRSQDKTACVSQLTKQGEKLVIFQEIQRHTATDRFPSIIEKMQGNLLEGYGIKANAIHLLPAGLMPKTRNYKISRRQCIENYLSGQLEHRMV